jgi:glutamate racemase
MKHLNAAAPIGVFDSGIGGLTVADGISRLLPSERLLYFGDTAHLPYGDKSPESILHYSETITEYLIGRGCKMVVIACNTASSIAYEHLQFKYGDQVLMVNVIDPVVKATVRQAGVRHVGVIGTKGTIQSNAYEKRIQTMAPGIKVSSLATPLLVPMIEEGYYNSSISRTIIDAYLNYPDFGDIQAMILGCTHYPLIKQEIAAFFEGKAIVMDSVEVVAKYVQQMLERFGLLSTKQDGGHHFLVSDFTESFEKTTRIFFREAITLEHLPIWEQG